MGARFVRLGIAGFKSFADATSLEILPGLTGIVGPNGCGKSNVAEALRWAMGEANARHLRGGEMDDVIFAGSAARPSRNLAEVSLTLEDDEHGLPPPFTGQAELHIARRIERGGGSAYRVNGREARARDVQTLFADLASGARSSAMVSQGRVGALVNARPEERRAVLEEAAGITGLTGGGAGIGFAIARSFAREGARVVIAGRTEASLMHAAGAIGAEYGQAILAVPADVAEPADCERVIATAIEKFGAVDILVNNAALFAVLSLMDADAAKAARFFAINAIGPLNAARAFARWAIENKREGAIVNVSSIAAGRPAPGLGLYSATKAALDSLTRTMAVEWAGHGLRVNAVAPGHVATEGVLADLKTGRLDERSVLARIPAGRIAERDDIADAVLFLCSDGARHILGQVITVDGGESF